MERRRDPSRCPYAWGGTAIGAERDLAGLVIPTRAGSSSGSACTRRGAVSRGGSSVCPWHSDRVIRIAAAANIHAGPDSAASSHPRFTLWATNDNGNRDRNAVPFTGQYAISGMDFPDNGGGNTPRGVEFRP